VDGIAANNGWSLRAISNNLYFATSTTAATSTPLLTFSSNFGIGIASTTPQPNGLTIGWGNLIMTAGQLAIAYASSTNPTQSNLIDWNKSGTSRIIASTTETIQINGTSSHPMDGGHYFLKVCQDVTGGRSVTFDAFTSGYLNFSMGTPTPPTAAGKGFMYEMIYDKRVARYDVFLATSSPAASCIP